MKRLITQLALLIAVLCASVQAYAYDCVVDGIYYNLNKSNRTAEVTYGDGKYKGARAINIPRSVRYNGSSYSVTSIGNDAFYYSSALTSVTIGNSVTSIGYYAFRECSGLKVMTCLAPNPPECGDYALTDIDKSKCTLYVLKESVNLYKAADQWKDFYNISGR